MKVETGGLVYDDNDKRCTINVKHTTMNKRGAYLILLSCYDGSTGSTNWYHGITQSHFYNLDEDGKQAIMLEIMQQGGKVWDLLDSLKSTENYLNDLYEQGLYK